MLPSDYISMGWCQFNFAEDIDKNLVDATSPKAVAWCALGAISVLGQEDLILYHDYRKELRKVIPGWISEWNDAKDRTKNEIIDVFKQVERNLALNIQNETDKTI